MSGLRAALLAGCLVTGLAASASAEATLVSIGPTFGWRLRDGAPEYGGELALWGHEVELPHVGLSYMSVDVGLTNRRFYSEVQLMLPATELVGVGLSPGLAYDFDRGTAEAVATAWVSFFGIVPYVRVGSQLEPLDLSAGFMLKLPIPFGLGM